MTKEEILNVMASDAVRVCNKCKKTLHVTRFSTKKTKGNERSYRFNSPCIKCSSNDRYKNYIKAYLRMRNFSLTTEQYESMLLEQNNKCKICGIDRSDVKKDFAVDHCHKTQKIRGLLCSNCNTGIGFLNDDISILRKAIKYLLTSKKKTRQIQK
jgi:hypothetical protein